MRSESVSSFARFLTDGTDVAGGICVHRLYMFINVGFHFRRFSTLVAYPITIRRFAHHWFYTGIIIWTHTNTNKYENLTTDIYAAWWYATSVRSLWGRIWDRLCSWTRQWQCAWTRRGSTWLCSIRSGMSIHNNGIFCQPISRSFPLFPGLVLKETPSWVGASIHILVFSMNVHF